MTEWLVAPTKAGEFNETVKAHSDRINEFKNGKEFDDVMNSIYSVSYEQGGYSKGLVEDIVTYSEIINDSKLLIDAVERIIASGNPPYFTHVLEEINKVETFHHGELSVLYTFLELDFKVDWQKDKDGTWGKAITPLTSQLLTELKKFSNCERDYEFNIYRFAKISQQSIFEHFTEMV